MRAIASHTKLEGKCRWVAILSDQRPREKTDTFLYWIQRGSLTVPPTQHLSNTNSTWGWVLSCTFRWVVKFLGTQEGIPLPTPIRPSWSSWSPSRHEKVSGSMDVNPGWWSTENFAITAIVFFEDRRLVSTLRLQKWLESTGPTGPKWFLFAFDHIEKRKDLQRSAMLGFHGPQQNRSFQWRHGKVSERLIYPDMCSSCICPGSWDRMVSLPIWQ
jgi:hypothetical protein